MLNNKPTPYSCPGMIDYTSKVKIWWQPGEYDFIDALFNSCCDGAFRTIVRVGGG